MKLNLITFVAKLFYINVSFLLFPSFPSLSSCFFPFKKSHVANSKKIKDENEIRVSLRPSCKT